MNEVEAIAQARIWVRKAEKYMNDERGPGDTARAKTSADIARAWAAIAAVEQQEAQG